MIDLSRFYFVLVFLTIGLGSIQVAMSQQKLNLDFEKLSVEGISRPWGWSVYSYAPGVHFICDSTNVKTGKYSLQIISSKEETLNNRFELSFFVEPSQILNSSITVDGYARTLEFKGDSGINIKSIGAVGEDYKTLSENEIGINASEHWQKYSSEIKINSQPHSVLVTLYFQGVGTVWFDNLGFTLNGKTITEVPVAPQFTDEQLGLIAEHTSAFNTVEPVLKSNPQPSDFSDLTYLKSIVKDSKIIALGESTHGTSEFFKVKHRILQYAILELGVRTFILEDNQLIAERINDYVLYGKGEAEKVIQGLFGVWNREEMLELIKWIRSYNSSHPSDKAEFVGIDVQNPQLAFKQTIEFLQQKDSALAGESEKLMADIKQEWKSSYFKTDSTLLKWDSDAALNYKIFSNNKSKWLAESKAKSDSIKVEWAIKNARTIKQFVETVLGGNYEGRDKAMAENVQWIVNQREPEAKFVIWAHDSHISRGDSKINDENFFLGESMGSYLSKEYESDYCALGLFTYQGSCLGTLSYSNFNLIEFDIYTSPEGSLDQGLHQISEDLNSNYLIMNLEPFKNDSEKFEWMNIKRPVRYVGYVAEDYGFGGRYSIPYQFDGIIFIDKSTAATEIITD